MKSHLVEYEPIGRDFCLCGSGVRFKNCCKKVYSKKSFNSRALFINGDYSEALKAIRAHITWYRLCHIAHTVPFLNSNSDESKKLLKTDIEALAEMAGFLLSCYEKCNILDHYLKALDNLKSAITDSRWNLKVDYLRCLYLYVYKTNKEAASVVLEKYNWEDLNDVDLLTIYLDIMSDELNQVSKINIATKIYGLTKSPSIKLQYGIMSGIQYCLLNDFDNGIPKIKKAIEEFEAVSEEKSSMTGSHHLSIAYKHLGELINDDSYIHNSAKLLTEQINTGKYSDLGRSQLWFDLAGCYDHLGELEKSIKYYDESISLNPTDLSKVFKSRILMKLKCCDEARELLKNIVIENLSEANYFDYVISKCNLAIHSLDALDISEGLVLIKKIKTNDPLFKDVVQNLLVQLFELQTTCNTAEEAESALMKFNRYVSLKPNFFGVGIDFNAIIDDFAR